MNTVNRNKLRKKLPMKHKKLKPINVASLKKLAIAIAITIIAVVCYIQAQPHTQDAKQEIQLEHKSQQLKSTRNLLEQQKVRDADTQKKLDETNKQLQETQKKLEAKRNSATAYAAELAYVPPVVQAPVVQAPVSAVVDGCGDNTYAQYIYSHESGCNLNAVNSIGCRGIGQACPGSKLPCGADYACQNAFFTQYANERYGSWAGAYTFWVNNHWW
jgi:hypothetical protein